jgi:predicted outer membrane repeat protein
VLSAHSRSPKSDRIDFRTALLGAAVSTLVASVLVGLGGTAQAATPSCHAFNRRTQVTTTNLQSALDAASSGDTIRVQGVCRGNFTVGQNHLHLLGKPTALAPEATLDGEGSGSVVTAYVHDLSVTDLAITDGQSSIGAGISGPSVLKLLGTTSVHDNRADPNKDSFGVGVYAGTAVLRDGAQVSDNSGGSEGGGIDAKRVILSDSAGVNGNSAGQYGGGIYAWASVSISGSAQVNGNTGGGIYIVRHTGVTMTDSAQVNGNTGTGISSRGPVTLGGFAQVDNNTTSGNVGGIFVFQKYDPWTITLEDSAEVIGNTAHANGGIDSKPGLLLACDASGAHEWTGAISPNTPDDPPPVTPTTC